MSVAGKVALVTGAASGIGRASARRLAADGARVAALDARDEDVREVADGLAADGHEAIAITADVADPEAMRQAVERVIETWGRLDVVFANAGINGVWAPIEELEPEEWDRTLAVNLKGTFLTIKYAAPQLKRRGGSVIVTSSINGTRKFSGRGASAYASSKAGQVALAKILALELSEYHVRVNAICPGGIKTQIGERTEHVGPPAEFPEGNVPLTHGGLGEPEQVARLVRFLAGDESDHVSGTAITIDGAESLLEG